MNQHFQFFNINELKLRMTNLNLNSTTTNQKSSKGNLKNSAGQQTDQIQAQLNSSLQTSSLFSTSKNFRLSQKIEVVDKKQNKENEPPRMIQNICSNHKQKKGKYYQKTKFKFLLYCSKCAIKLIQQGEAILELTEEIKQKNLIQDQLNLKKLKPTNQSYLKKKQVLQEVNNAEPSKPEDELTSSPDFNHEDQIAQDPETEHSQSRKNDLNQFQTALDNVKNQTMNCKTQIQTKKMDIQYFYDSQILQVDKISQSLQDLIDKQKNCCMNQLKDKMDKSNVLFHKYENILEFHLKELTEIESDINQTLDQILFKMNDQPFQEILSKYYNKLSSQKNFLSTLLNQPLDIYSITPNPNASSLHEPLISLFNLTMSHGNLLPEESMQFLTSTSPEKVKKSSKQKQKQEVLISFENKDIFTSQQIDVNKQQQQQYENEKNFNMSPPLIKTPAPKQCSHKREYNSECPSEHFSSWITSTCHDNRFLNLKSIMANKSSKSIQEPKSTQNKIAQNTSLQFLKKTNISQKLNQMVQLVKKQTNQPDTSVQSQQSPNKEFKDFFLLIEKKFKDHNQKPIENEIQVKATQAVTNFTTKYQKALFGVTQQQMYQPYQQKLNHQ